MRKILINLFCLAFEEKEDPATRSFFSEIISSVSDVKFSHSGRYILTRDYLSVNVSFIGINAIHTNSIHTQCNSYPSIKKLLNVSL